MSDGVTDSFISGTHGLVGAEYAGGPGSDGFPYGPVFTSMSGPSSNNAEYQKLAGTVSISNWNFAGYCLAGNQAGNYNGQSSLSGNILTLYSAGWQDAATLVVTCPPYTISYAGFVGDWDGTPRGGVTLSGGYVSGTTSGTVDGNGNNFSASVTRPGIWQYYQTGVNWSQCGYPIAPNGSPPRYYHAWNGSSYNDYIGCVASDSPEFVSATDENAVIIGGLAISNCKTIGEPDFCYASDSVDNFREYSDERIELQLPEGSWPIAGSSGQPLTLNIPASKTAVTFPDADSGQWSVTAGSGSVGSDGSGHLKITANSGPTTVQTAYYASSILSGARYVDFVYSSDDTSAITVQIAGRQYSVTPSNYRIDLLAPMNPATINAPTQSLYVSSGEPAWDWGIHQAGTIELIGLRGGHEYTLTAINLVRVNPAQVHIFRCPFVGDQPDVDGSGDVYSIYNPSFNPSAPDWYTRIGIVLVDGVVGAEILGVVHTLNDPSGENAYWTHDVIAMSASVVYPNAGLVTVSSYDPTCYSTYLQQGIFAQSSGSSTLSLGATPFSGFLTVPCAEATRTMCFTKYLRGQPAIRVVNAAGSAAVPVTVKTNLVDASGNATQVASETINVSGPVQLFSPKPQNQMVWGQINSISGSTYTVDALVGSQNYTGFRIYIDTGTTQPNGAVIIASHNPSTGQITLASQPPGTISVNNPACVLLTYQYVASAPAASGMVSQTLNMRNRCLSFATLLAYASNIVQTNNLKRSPATGNLMRNNMTNNLVHLCQKSS